MKDSRALPSKGGLIGIALTLVGLVLLGVALWFTWQAATGTELQQAIQSPDATPDPATPDQVLVANGTNLGTFGLGLLSFGLFLLLIYLAYQTRRFFALRYTLDRNAITIKLGDRQQVIPLANIRHVVPATTVLNQMRQRVYGSEDAKEAPKTGPVAKAYPRQKPAVASEAAQTVSEAEIKEIETQVQVEAQEADGETEAYQMSQSAAADSSLEASEIEAADFTEIEDITPLHFEEGQIRALTPTDFKALAVEFGDEPGSQSGPATNANPDSTEDFASGGSVNFQVKAPWLSSWPGFYLNRASVASLGAVQFYATRPLAETLLVRTDRQTYAISPVDASQFVTEFNLRRRLGAIEPVSEGVIPGSFLSHPLWHDKLGRGLILAGVILNLLLYVYLIARFDELKPTLRMHFNKFGNVDQIGDKTELMYLPFVGLLTVVGNSLLGAFIQPKDRIPAYLLYGAAILLQILTAIAIFVILAVSGS